MKRESIIPYFKCRYNSSKDRPVSIVTKKFKDRYLTQAETLFLEKEYKEAQHSFKNFLHKREKEYNETDDRLIVAHERLGDIHVLLDERKHALFEYRCAIKKLRYKKEHFNTSTFQEKKLILDIDEHFIRVLVKSADVHLSMAKDSKVHDTICQSCNFAIECYDEAFPLAQIYIDFFDLYTMHVAKRLCAAREVYGNELLHSKKSNMAASLFEKNVSILKKYLQQADDFDETSSSYEATSFLHTLNEFQNLFLKNTMQLALIYHAKNRIYPLVELLGNALLVIGLSQEEIDMKKIHTFDNPIKKTISVFSDLMGEMCTKLSLYQQAIMQYNRSIYLKKMFFESTLSPTIGLGFIYYHENDFHNALHFLLKASQSNEFREAVTFKDTYEKCYFIISIIYQSQNNYSESLYYLNQLAQYYDKCLYDENVKLLKMSNLWHKIACLKTLFQCYNDALSSHLTSLELKRKIGVSYDIASTLQHIGFLHLAIDNHHGLSLNAAYMAFKESLEYANEKQKVIAFFQMGNLMNCEYEAIESYQTCLSLVSTSNSYLDCIKILMQCFYKLGMLYVKLGDTEAASKKMEEALIILKQISRDSFDASDEHSLSPKDYIWNYDSSLTYFSVAFFMLTNMECTQIDLVHLSLAFRKD